MGSWLCLAVLFCKHCNYSNGTCRFLGTYYVFSWLLNDCLLGFKFSNLILSFTHLSGYDCVYRPNDASFMDEADKVSD